MEIVDARIMAKRLMEQHGITREGWRLELDNAVRRLGATHYHTRRITLSKHLIALNTEDIVRQTVLHEIAHVLAGPTAGHGPEWRRLARSLGHSGERVNRIATVPTGGRYVATCATCGATNYRHRKTARMDRTACGKCCKQYNGGRYSAEFALTYVDTGVTAG